MRSQKNYQLLSGTWKKDHFAFGGDLLKGSHPKKKRPFHKKLPLHLVLRSSKAKGKHSLLSHSQKIARLLSNQAGRHHVKILGVANAGNHIHLIVVAPSRSLLNAFIRGITGRIAQLVNTSVQENAGKGSQINGSINTPQSPDETFWDARPFSRIISWGRDLNQLKRYLTLNSTEILGLGRQGARRMFIDILDALKAGLIPKSRTLVAMGFG